MGRKWLVLLVLLAVGVVLGFMAYDETHSVLQATRNAERAGEQL